MKKFVVLASIQLIGCGSDPGSTSASSSAPAFSIAPIVAAGPRSAPPIELPKIQRDDEIFSGVNIENADVKMTELWQQHSSTIRDAVNEINRTPASGPDCNAPVLALFRGFDATWKWLDSGIRSYEKEYGKPFRLSAEINAANEEIKACMSCAKERSPHCAKAIVATSKVDSMIKIKTAK